MASLGLISRIGFGVPACTTVKVADPIVTVPVRSRKLGFVPTAKVIVESPNLLPGSTTETQDAFGVTFHVVVDKAVTET